MATEQVISDEARQEIEKLFVHLPTKKAACIDALKVVQKHNRWVSDQALVELGPILGMTPHEIDGIATFYNIIFRRPVGRHVIYLCNSVSCWILGFEEVHKALKEKLQIDFGMTTKDDRFTFLPIPCIGTCDHAPAMIVDEDLYRDLKPEGLDEILAKYE
ncbi:MAG: NADH-quinone oxidoreductase subunit NuoE [Chitinophagaceae bacterium]|nr:NADH-quinone oxidoreductase subunit NuoE [Chitinophagaceae bacterium]